MLPPLPAGDSCTAPALTRALMPAQRRGRQARVRPDSIQQAGARARAQQARQQSVPRQGSAVHPPLPGTTGAGPCVGARAREPERAAARPAAKSFALGASAGWWYGQSPRCVHHPNLAWLAHAGWRGRCGRPTQNEGSRTLAPGTPGRGGVGGKSQRGRRSRSHAHTRGAAHVSDPPGRRAAAARPASRQARQRGGAAAARCRMCARGPAPCGPTRVVARVVGRLV